MMRALVTWPLCLFVLAACESKWSLEDGDGDGISAAEGDCWDKKEGPEGSSLSGSDIHPDATETWYDGFDQNCAGDDDYDADADGYVLEEYVGLETSGLDGSGFLPPGDCWDEPEGPGDGAIGGAEIYEGAADTWYDGVDQDCGGEDDFDADGDGYVADANVGAETYNVEGTGGLEGGDCWDDPEADPGMEPVDESSEAYRASAVHSNVPMVDDEEACDEAGGECEYWYDGIDSNCDGADDFDWDEDGQRSQSVDDATGNPAGTDCFDHPEDDALPAEVGLSAAMDELDLDNQDVLDFMGLGPADIYDGADDPFYDGLNQDCGDYGLDCDADLDTFNSDGGGLPACADEPDHPLCEQVVCELVDCNDEDASVLPDDTPEVYYNGIDDNCDFRDGDGDADNDGFWADDYADRVEETSPGATPLDVPIGADGDCNDDNSAINPGQPELWYDGTDANCDEADDYDQDGDGYYHRDYDVAYAASGGSLDGNDCDDDPTERGADVNPSATEVWYDGVDQDCNGQDDYDYDDDGFHSRDHESSYGATDYIAGSGVLPGNDCDDTRTDVYDGAPDAWYSGEDEDCDGRDDFDQDEDGFYSRGHTYTATTYAAGTGVLDGNDCNDTNPDVNPDATETCSTSYDDDCDDDENDEDALICNVYHADRDDDLHGLADDSKCYCETRGHYTVTDSHVATVGGDCDDTDDDIHPSHSDTWYDGVDSNCSGNDDFDRDGDGYVRDADVGESTHPVPGSGGLPGGDCNDNNDAVHPDRTELCSTVGVDDDCDGNDNDPGATGCVTRYADVDTDGYGDPDDSLCLCAHEGIYNEFDSDDCDDSSSTTHPSAATAEPVSPGACRKDDDGDNYGDLAPGSGITAGTDCDDDRSDVNPGAPDAWYSGDDEDCDGRDDFDRDGDGFVRDGDVGEPTTYAPGTGFLPGGDCNDANAAVNPDAIETCATAYDDDCDGNDNDDGAVGCKDMFADADGDTWGDEDDEVCYCYEEGVYAEVDVHDCDDTKSGVFPGRIENCGTPYDDNCDGEVNEIDALGCDTFCRDADGDDYGDDANEQCSCEAFSGYVDDCEDCNDAVTSIHPGATESCDMIDSDCDGSRVDSFPNLDGDSLPDCVDDDDDGDGFDAIADGGTDCDDTDADINPAETEIWYDGVDSDCGEDDDYDADGDGYRSDSHGGTDCDDTDDDVNPGETEVWYDGVDADCEDDDDYDADGDGYQSDSHGGTDCDDTDDDINPGEADSGDEGVDDNCDGYIDEDEVFALRDASPAQDVLLFSELQINPAAPANEKQWEWFEVYNNTSQTLYLDNWRFSICTVSGSCRRFNVASSKALSVDAGEVLLFCYNSTFMNASPTPGADCDYNYGSSFSGASFGEYNSLFQLINSGSTDRELSVDLDGEILDSVNYHGPAWPSSIGQGQPYQFDGAQLTGTATDLSEANDDYSPDWCSNGDIGYVYHTHTTGPDYGSPGEVNPACDDL